MGSSHSYSFADNQLDNVREFDREGLIRYAGDVRTDHYLENITKIMKIYNKDAFRTLLSKKMQKEVDGWGSYRIAQEILKS